MSGLAKITYENVDNNAMYVLVMHALSDPDERTESSLIMMYVKSKRCPQSVNLSACVTARTPHTAQYTTRDQGENTVLIVHR